MFVGENNPIIANMSLEKAYDIVKVNQIFMRKVEGPFYPQPNPHVNFSPFLGNIPVFVATM